MDQSVAIYLAYCSGAREWPLPLSCAGKAASFPTLLHETHIIACKGKAVRVYGPRSRPGEESMGMEQSASAYWVIMP